MVKLHLGCGKKYINGWINIDQASGVADELIDLRRFLPYSDNSVDFIFNEHFIEHLTRREAFMFLKECYRVLSYKGVLRISTPDLEYLITKYKEKDLTEWNDERWFPMSACQMMNEGMTDWGHKFLYDYEELYSVLELVGFSKITLEKYKESKNPELRDLESRFYHKELIAEAVK